MNVTSIREGHHNPDVLAVADEVRGLLAKRRIAAYRIGELLNDGSSRSYWQRRVAGDIAFDINDLSHLAALLGVSIADFIPRAGRPTPSGSRDEKVTRATVDYRVDAAVVSLDTFRTTRTA